MKIVTSDGQEIEISSIIIDEKPKKVSFRISDATIYGVVTTLCKEGALPIVGYEEYTELYSIGKINPDDVMVTLRPLIE